MRTYKTSHKYATRKKGIHRLKPTRRLTQRLRKHGGTPRGKRRTRKHTSVVQLEQFSDRTEPSRTFTDFTLNTFPLSLIKEGCKIIYTLKSDSKDYHSKWYTTITNVTDHTFSANKTIKFKDKNHQTQTVNIDPLNNKSYYKQVEKDSQFKILFSYEYLIEQIANTPNNDDVNTFLIFATDKMKRLENKKQFITNSIKRSKKN